MQCTDKSMYIYVCSLCTSISYCGVLLKNILSYFVCFNLVNAGTGVSKLFFFYQKKTFCISFYLNSLVLGRKFYEFL